MDKKSEQSVKIFRGARMSGTKRRFGGKGQLVVKCLGEERASIAEQYAELQELRRRFALSQAQGVSECADVELGTGSFLLPQRERRRSSH